jgi:hypothetical protein
LIRVPHFRGTRRALVLNTLPLAGCKSFLPA